MATNTYFIGKWHWRDNFSFKKSNNFHFHWLNYGPKYPRFINSNDLLVFWKHFACFSSSWTGKREMHITEPIPATWKQFVRGFKVTSWNDFKWWFSLSFVCKDPPKDKPLLLRSSLPSRFFPSPSFDLFLSPSIILTAVWCQTTRIYSNLCVCVCAAVGVYTHAFLPHRLLFNTHTHLLPHLWLLCFTSNKVKSSL